jgi:succinate dehydrogenase / fumarate reductase flavoprotein subunit
MNQGAQYVRHLRNMIVLARIIAQGARNRDESRGAHFKPDLPQRDDASWLRTTFALHAGGEDGRRDTVRFVRAIDYDLLSKNVHATDEVDVSMVRPRPRKYGTS